MKTSKMHGQYKINDRRYFFDNGDALVALEVGYFFTPDGDLFEVKGIESNVLPSMLEFNRIGHLDDNPEGYGPVLVEVGSKDDKEIKE